MREETISAGRLIAFTHGVFAVIMTVMVLDLKAPDRNGWLKRLKWGCRHIFGANFSGFVAWFLWRSIYLSKLPRSEKKLHVALDWTLDLLFSKDIVSFLDRRS
jgi:uncharacterized membrane protein